MNTTAQVKKLENRISELEQENKRLHDSVEYLTRKLFGRSSEKTSSLALGQISFFDEAEIQADPKALEPDLNEVHNYRRKKFNGQHMEFLKDIPHDKLTSVYAHFLKMNAFVKPVGLLLYQSERNSYVQRSNTYLQR